MVVEGEILFGVQHLKEGRGGVAPKVRAHLIHFVQAEDRVVALGLAQGLDDLTGQGPDIGAPVAPDFGFIPHPAQGQPHKIAPQGPGHGFGQRSFSHSRRPHQAENGTFHLFHQALHRQIFQDALLGLFETVMVFFQDALRLGDVVVVLGLLVPGEGQEPVDVIPGDRGFGAHGAHELELFHLVLHFARGFGAHALFLEAPLQFLDFPLRSSLSPISFWMARICSLR